MKQKQLIMHGNISVSSKSNKEAEMLLVLTERVLCIEKNEVKSFNPKNTEDISKEIKPLSCEVFMPHALMTTDDGYIKIFNLDNVRSTTNNGKKSLELTVSTDAFESHGATTANALLLDNLSNQEDVTIIVETTTPTFGNLLESNLDNFRTLTAAIKAVDFTNYENVRGLFNGNKTYTFFTPNENAFKKLPVETVQELLKLENKIKLQNLLADHVFEGAISVSDIKKKKFLKTVHGKRIKVELRKDGTVLVGGAKIVDPDGRVSNGYYHVTNKVLV